MKLKFIDQWFGNSGQAPEAEDENSFYQTLYPEEVRYALRYKGAQIGKPEILSLVDRFTYEAHYLVAKAFSNHSDPECQFADHLTGLTQLFQKPDYKLDDLKAYLRQRIPTLPSDTQVLGTKLAQLSRAGSGRWQSAFRQLAESCLEEYAEAQPCLIAHTSLLGYHHFVQVYSQKPDARLLILIPELLMDTNDPGMGYRVILGPNPSVKRQPKEFCIFANWSCLGEQCRLNQKYCTNTVFVDDTINTGATVDKIKSFWHSEYALFIPPERIKVITDLRYDQPA